MPKMLLVLVLLGLLQGLRVEAGCADNVVHNNPAMSQTQKQKQFSIIAAMSTNRGIGYKNNLPWPSMPNDYQRMLAMSRGHHVVMGRRTFEEINKQSIPGTVTIVVTRSTDYTAPDNVVLVSSIEEALKRIPESAEAILLGGGQLYQEALNKSLVNRMHVTYIDAEVPADTFFPEFNLDEWRVVEEQRHSADERHPFSYRFVTYERK